MFAYPTLLIALALITAAPFGILLAVLKKPAASKAASELRRTLAVLCGTIVGIAVIASVYNGLQNATLVEIGTAAGIGFALLISSYTSGWTVRRPALGWKAASTSESSYGFLRNTLRNSPESYSGFLRDTLRNIALGAPLLSTLALIRFGFYEGNFDPFFKGVSTLTAVGVALLLLEFYNTRENILTHEENATAR